MNDSQIHAEELPGGVIRVSHHQAQPAHWLPPAGQPHDDVRVHTGVVREGGGGTFVREGGGGHSSGGSVLSTAKNNAGPTSNLRGSDVTVELIPGDPSSRTSVAVALQEGVLRQVAPGVYEDAMGSRNGAVGGAPNAPSGVDPTDQQDPEAEESQAPELFDSTDEAEWASVIEPMDQQAYDNATARAAGSSSWDEDVNALARDAGIDHAQASEYMSHGYRLFEGQVAKVGEAAGIGADQRQEWYDWMRQQHGREVTAAIQELTTARRADTFRALAAAFNARNGR